ncbi:MAG: GNAT family N-acetyltransferase, partial [Duncaniella sp.]|nr:GNAT family N-acetyltransferase [Duncaniella sp.]
LIGFSYIESWEHGDYVATSGLIVDPEFRRLGLAARIKAKTFELARLRFPFAKLFSITTSLPVMKLNSQMGYKPVTFSELTDDEEFWAGCKGCVNFDILQRNNRRMCLCTGMLYDPKAKLERPSKRAPYVMWLHNRVKKLLHLK